MTFEVPIGHYVVYNIALTSQNLMKKDNKKDSDLSAIDQIHKNIKQFKEIEVGKQAIISASSDRVDFLGLSILR